MRWWGRRWLVTVVVVIFAFAVPSCRLLDPGRQPNVSIDVRNKQFFTSDTQFPYHADPDRTAFIIERSGRINIGMTGDEVLEAVGPPDEAQALAHAFELPFGYSWDYFIDKRFPRAPDDGDRGVSIYFDKSGLVKEVDRKTLLTVDQIIIPTGDRSAGDMRSTSTNDIAGIEVAPLQGAMVLSPHPPRVAP